MLKNIFKAIAEIVFPNKCIFCREILPSEKYYCESCMRELDGNLCAICYKPVENCTCNFSFDYTISPVAYSDKTRSTISNLKTHQNPRTTSILAGLMLAVYQEKDQRLCENTIIVPVPTTILKFKERGFNQAESLAVAFGKLANFPVKTDLLIRQEASLPQQTLKRPQRFENAEKSYFSSGISLNGESVILIDDVATTGATLNACGKALKKQGAGKIIAICASATTDGNS